MNRLWTAGAFAFALLLAGGVNWVSWRGITRLAETSRAVARTHEVQSTLQHFLSSFSRAVAEQRGFLLTTEPRYLDASHEALAGLDLDLDRLRLLTRDNPDQQGRLAAMAPLIRKKKRILEERIAIRKTRGLAAVVAAIKAEPGEKQAARLREIVMKMDDEEGGFLAARAAQSQSAARRASAAIFFGASASGMILVVVFFALLREIGRRLGAESDLRKQTDLLSAILENMGEGVVVADARGKFLVFNPAAERIVGVGMTDAAPPDWQAAYGIFLPDQRTPMPVEALPLMRAIRGEVVREALLFIRNPKMPDGVWISVSGNPMKDKTGAAIGGMVLFRDVTEKKIADEDKHRLILSLAVKNDELASVNKELETFSYSVSHDLRAPLRALDGFSRVLAEEYGPRLDEEAVRLIGVVRASTQRMGQLIDDLLAFSRLGRKEISKSRVDMSRLFVSVFEELKSAREARLPRCAVGEMPAALGDPALIHQVVSNLLSNAIKFTGKKESAHIEVGGARKDEVCEYFVKDNGAGFDMRYAHKLFGVFQRLHGQEEFEGTGVGLAIVQRVIHRHGGRVWAESRPDEGATFYFTLPANND